MSSERVHDTLRLSEAELARLFEDFEGAASAAQARFMASKRRMKRWTMQMQRAVATILGSMGERVNIIVAPRNISGQGLAFLAGQYIHVGTDCIITLRNAAGNLVPIEARIVRCRHVTGHIHDFGVAFESPINARDFRIDPDADNRFESERVELNQLGGVVLVIDDEPTFQALLSHYFNDASLDIAFADTGEEGLSRMDQHPHLILVDHHLPDMKGLELIEQARSRGHKMPIILMSADSDEELRSAAIGAGADEFICKSAPPSLYHQAIAEYLSPKYEHEALTGQPTIVPTPARQAFASTLNELVTELSEAMEQSNGDFILKKIMMLRSTAPGYGFAEIGEAAEGVYHRLKTDDDITQCSRELQRLIRVCRRAEAA